jgi:hypothetical protein
LASALSGGLKKARYDHHHDKDTLALVLSGLTRRLMGESGMKILIMNIIPAGIMTTPVLIFHLYNQGK